MWNKTESEMTADLCKPWYSWRLVVSKTKKCLHLTFDSFKEESQYIKVRKALKLFCKEIDKQKNDWSVDPIKISQLLWLNDNYETQESTPKYNYIKYLDVRLPDQPFTLRDFFHLAIKALLWYPENHSKLDELIPEVLLKVCKINKIARSMEEKSDKDRKKDL